MKFGKITPALLICIALFSSTASKAETIKKEMLGCVSEDLLDELLGYINKKDESGFMQLVYLKKCMLLPKGESVSVISSGFMTATIRYKGVKLYTPSEAIR